MLLYIIIDKQVQPDKLGGDFKLQHRKYDLSQYNTFVHNYH